MEPNIEATAVAKIEWERPKSSESKPQAIVFTIAYNNKHIQYCDLLSLTRFTTFLNWQNDVNDSVVAKIKLKARE